MLKCFVSEEVLGIQMELPNSSVVVSYIIHGFPYAQSAFNWLFYAFLNRNLRHSSTRPSQISRPLGITSALLDHHRTTSLNGSFATSSRNIEINGKSLKPNGSGVAVSGRKAHFRLRTPIASRYFFANWSSFPRSF